MAAHETNESGQEQGPDAEGGDSRAARTHLSAAGLRARGWTAGMVRELLGEPDLLRVHPHFQAAPRIRLYCVERVEAAERSEEFRSVSAAAARRSAAARVAARRRRREVLARIAAEPNGVPRPASHKPAAPGAESTGPTALDRGKVDSPRHRRVYAAITEAFRLLARERERRLSEREYGPPPE